MLLDALGTKRCTRGAELRESDTGGFVTVAVRIACRWTLTIPQDRAYRNPCPSSCSGRFPSFVQRSAYIYPCHCLPACPVTTLDCRK